ncbi:hypothetical protein IGI04_033470 [Brassica rapa subsp. trilocularis]|uniref:Reverse transcriptase zinc-binding domain-containing protein n=1 Tax=Brassica rapa subsp. trilocularis TaxID=1813537 RepID=A0ABQ7L8S4_BRACM|nr:hypothetical protein IGI04_033470 [Brassica rapa subsp. trilocularis]
MAKESNTSRVFQTVIFYGRSVCTNPPSDLHSAAAWILHGARHGQAQATTLLKLFLQSTIYLIWRERNARIFTSTATPLAALRVSLDRLIRDRLLSGCCGSCLL